MENSKSIQRAIQSLALDKGCAIADLGKELGVAGSTVIRWANGRAQNIRNSHWANLKPLIESYLPKQIDPRFEQVYNSSTATEKIQGMLNYMSKYNLNVKKLAALVRQPTEVMQAWLDKERTIPKDRWYWIHEECIGKFMPTSNIATEAQADELQKFKKDEIHFVPVVTAAMACGWDPMTETLEDYINEDTERIPFFGRDIKASWVSLRVSGDSMGDELPHGSAVLVAMNELPISGKRVVAKLKTGCLIIKRYFRKNNVIRLESDGHGRRWEWKCKEEVPPVEWMKPVKMVIVKE